MSSSDKKTTKTGANASQKPSGFVSYTDNHKKVLKQSLYDLKKRPLSTLFTFAVIGISLVLPFLLYAVINSFQAQEIDFSEDATLSIFFKPEVGLNEAKKAHLALSSRREFLSTEFVHKDEAWQELASQLDLEAVNNTLQENPLPHSVKATLRPESTEPSRLESLEKNLELQKTIEDVIIDNDWIKRLNALSELAQVASTLLSIILGVAVVLIVGNTIRLSIENRKEEITVLKLVGGTDAFVSRPLLYSGTLLGLGGGVTAVIGTTIMVVMINEPLEKLLGSYGQSVPLIELGFVNVIVIIALSAFLGWLGALISVKKHLKDIQPT